VSIERRAFLTGAAAVFAGSAARAQNWEDYKDPKIVAAEPKAPLWPSKERFPLWPGLPPGAPKPLPRPGWQMFPDGPQLWVKGIAMPEVNVFRHGLRAELSSARRRMGEPLHRTAFRCPAGDEADPEPRRRVQD
jgi:hypothetical protein